jgi:hypothetical protein
MRSCFSEVRDMAGFYGDLVACRKAMVFVREIYLATQVLPKEEVYGLKSHFEEQQYRCPAISPKAKPVIRD